ncbi:MAG: hypothetical protein JO218_14440 [Burkholderiales bacterium]|nr:hypothetical protein [Burkholderiales bacterium]
MAGALAIAPLAAAQAGAVAAEGATGLMQINRTEHTASLLPNGNVLIAGGRTLQSGSLFQVSTAEIYDPSTGTFTPTGSMMYPRNLHVAATLFNGNILVAGGHTATAELFNPATGTWTPTGNMRYPRTWAQAIVLKDGRVLVIGDESFGPAASSSELYDPATGQFTPSGNLPQQRFGTSAALLADGRVLLAGGGTRGTAPGKTNTIIPDLVSLIWDPASGQWSTGPVLAKQHMNGTATALANGTVLLAGGIDSTGNAAANAEIVDPAAPYGTVTGSMTTPRAYAVASVQSDGTVLVAGGEGNTPGHGTIAAVESYSPSTGSWQSAGALTSSRYNFTASLLGNGNTLIAGGFTANTMTGQFTPLAGADLVEPVSPACANGAASIPWPGIGSPPPSGGSRSIPVSAAPGCTWTVATSASWITLGNLTGSGNGSFSMTVAPDTFYSRSGSLSINGIVVPINQGGPAQLCSPQVVSINPTSSSSIAAAGGSGVISVTANAGCGWQVTGVPWWVTLTSASQGIGSGTVTFTVGSNENTSATRNATMQIGQDSFYIFQY